MGKKSKLLASCVCIVDAIGNLKFYFEPSDVGSVDLEFMKNLHPRYVADERFNAAILCFHRRALERVYLGCYNNKSFKTRSSLHFKVNDISL